MEEYGIRWNNVEYHGIAWKPSLPMPHRCPRWPSRGILARRAVFLVFWSPEHRAIWSCSTLFHCIPLYSILFHTMLSHASPWYSMVFHTILYYSVLFHFIPSYSRLFHVIPRYPIVFHVSSMPFHDIPCCSILFHAIPCYPMRFHGIPLYSIHTWTLFGRLLPHDFGALATVPKRVFFGQPTVD